MRRIFLIFLLLFFVMIFCQKVEAQQVITQFLPHFVAGSLPASDWESEIFLANLSGKPNNVTVDFFDNTGNPLVVSTNRGTNSSFIVNLPKPLSDSVSSDVLQILRNSDSFVTGWVKTYSTEPFAVDLEFRQFLSGGTEPVGKADVAPSPVENVMTYPLSPKNGIALVNPGSQDANITFSTFDRAGNRIREGAFMLKRGGHMAVFFNQEPFLLDTTGVIVVASNIPLSSIVLNVEGLVFKTIPRIPTPRRLDSQRSATKIGFVYIYSDDRQSQPGVLDRITEYVGFQQALLDKEMPLNGFNRVQLPYDLDEQGLPKLAVINGGNREQYFDYNKTGFERVRWDLLSKEIDAKTSSDWTEKVVFVDVWIDRQVNGMYDDIIINGGGVYSWLSAAFLPFLNKNYFGDKRPYRGVPIPEFGGKPVPKNVQSGMTFEDLADDSIAVVNHENGHTFWKLGHSDAYESRFLSMVSGSGANGCINPKRLVECILLPIEAFAVAIKPFSKLSDHTWISEDISVPKVEILSKEIIGSKIRVIFKAKDPQSGIGSFSIQTIHVSPMVRHWKQISHLDDLENLIIETDISGVSTNIYLEVMNNQGLTNFIRLF